jgi:hypothetical protein
MSQYGAQYGGQNPSQQYPSQYGEQQDQSQYGAQDPSGGYDGQDQSQQDPSQYDPSQPQYGEAQGQPKNYQYGADDQNQDEGQQDPSQYGQESQNGQGYAQQKPPQQRQQAARERKPETSPRGQQKPPAMNGHTEKPEDDDRAVVKPSSYTAVQGQQKPGRSYHPTHHNALHYMAKAAGECLRLPLLQALQVLTSKLQATASRRSILTASFIWAPTPWVLWQTPTALPPLSQFIINDGALASVKS